MLVLDAYNILHVTGVLPAEIAGIDVSGLIDLVRVSRYGRDEVVVVCDGVRRDDAARSEGHVRVVFAGGEHEADDVIEGLLAKTPRSKRAIVVSTDARLRKAAGRHHARILRSEVFLHQLAIDHAAHGRGAGPVERRYLRPEFAVDLPLDKVSVVSWAAEMGIDVDLGETRPARVLAAKPVESKMSRRSGGGGLGLPLRVPSEERPKSGADSSRAPQTADLDMEKWLAVRPMLAEDKPGEGGKVSRAARSGVRAGGRRSRSL